MACIRTPKNVSDQLESNRAGDGNRTRTTSLEGCDCARPDQRYPGHHYVVGSMGHRECPYLTLRSGTYRARASSSQTGGPLIRSRGHGSVEMCGCSQSSVLIFFMVR